MVQYQYHNIYHTIKINQDQSRSSSKQICQIRHIHHAPGALQEAAEAMHCQRPQADCSHLAP